MLNPCLASPLSVFCVLVGTLSGCSPQSLAPGKAVATPDGSADTSPAIPGDASRQVVDGAGPLDARTGCDCQIGGDGVLKMSWSCFQTSYGNGSPESGWCGAPGEWTTACGFVVFTYHHDGLSNVYVYDQSGAQVGLRYQNVDTAFVCPDSLQTSLTVASGVFPDSSCPTTTCTCNADRTVSCPTLEAGVGFIQLGVD